MTWPVRPILLPNENGRSLHRVARQATVFKTEGPRSGAGDVQVCTEVCTRRADASPGTHLTRLPKPFPLEQAG
jgi:hypothetical protein